MFKGKIEDEERSQDLKSDNGDKRTITTTKIKLLYEKFCFANRFEEEDLTSDFNNSILKSYGYIIGPSSDEFELHLTKIDPELNSKLIDLRFKTLPKIITESTSSLDIFMDKIVKRTKREEDQIGHKKFVRIYTNFCKRNGLTKDLIREDIWEKSYGIHTKKIIQQCIISETDPTEDSNEVSDQAFCKKYLLKSCYFLSFWKWLPRIQIFYPKDESNKKSLIQKLLHCLFCCCGCCICQGFMDILCFWQWRICKYYIIDIEGAEAVIEWSLKAVAKPLTDLKAKKLAKETDIKDAITANVFYNGWWFVDALLIIIHLLLGVFGTLIFFITLILLSETQYEPFTLKTPGEIMIWNDMSKDPSYVFQRLFLSFSWNVTLIGVGILNSLIVFGHMLFYYTRLEVRNDKILENMAGTKLFRLVEWVLFTFFLAVVCGYIGVVIAWTLLGAIIDPNAFLPFATAAVTFVTFIFSKYHQLKSTCEEGKEAVKKKLKNAIHDKINKVLGKIGQSIDISALFQGMKQDIQIVCGKITSTNTLDPEIITKFQQDFTDMAKNSAWDTLMNASNIKQHVDDLKEKLVGSFSFIFLLNF